jgi:hypothetical protein
MRRQGKQKPTTPAALPPIPRPALALKSRSWRCEPPVAKRKEA